MRFYRARITRVVDGDTLDAEIDCGFHVVRTERVRLLGVDTPEVRGEEREAGLAAKEFVERWVLDASVTGTVETVTFGPCSVDLNGQWPILLLSEKGDAFGRWLVYVADRAGRSLKADLIESGHGAPI